MIRAKRQRRAAAEEVEDEPEPLEAGSVLWGRRSWLRRGGRHEARLALLGGGPLAAGGLGMAGGSSSSRSRGVMVSARRLSRVPWLDRRRMSGASRVICHAGCRRARRGGGRRSGGGEWPVASGAGARAFRAAFPCTLPIFAGFWFLGFAYGVYMNVSGFGFWFRRS